MMFSYCVLGSSSSGNCTLVQTSAGTTFLIDAGFSGREIVRRIAEVGIVPEQIDAVFITHEHCDHCDGIRGLAKYKNIRWYASAGTVKMLSEKTKVEWNVLKRGGNVVSELGDLKIRAFSVPHDSQDAVAYVFESGGEKLAWMSDCGKTGNVCFEMLKDVRTLFLESNYDLKMLRNSGRPYDLIERICSSHGHLSNEQCAAFLENLSNDVLKRVYFIHVSRDCNDVEIVRELCGNVVLKNWRGAAKFEVVDPRAAMPENARRGF